jgi:hypothetical protein
MTRNATTCLCVVLRNKQGYAKKLVFHNGREKISSSMEAKANELYYGIRSGYQAHAEAEFIQFLLQRKKQNSERYTHILGMGCSRRHCKECNCLLKLFLGGKYHSFIAAIHEEPKLPEITNTEKGCDISCKAQATLIYGSNAVNNDGRRSNRYYIPKILQKYIKEKTNWDIDFSADRFAIKDEESMVEKKNRQRKAILGVIATMAV